VSDLICLGAGLDRRRDHSLSRGSVFVPGAHRLESLSDLLRIPFGPIAGARAGINTDTLAPLTREQGSHDASAASSDETYVVRPFTSTANELVVSAPTDLILALRHFLICEAIRRDCVAELASGLANAAFAMTMDSLTVLGLRPMAAATRDPLTGVIGQSLRGDAGGVVQLALAVDNLASYDLKNPWGTWETDNVSELLIDTFTDRESMDPRIVRLAVIAGVGRGFFFGIENAKPIRSLVHCRLDELLTMIDAGGNDPLFLWRFATAVERLHAESRVLVWSTLDLYGMYVEHAESFYVSDERMPDLVSVMTDFGQHVRRRVRDLFDRHYVLSPDRTEFVEVVALDTAALAPLYFPHPRYQIEGLLYESDRGNVWVLHDDLSPREGFGANVGPALAEATIYWLWQIATLGEQLGELPKGLEVRLERVEDLEAASESQLFDCEVAGRVLTIRCRALPEPVDGVPVNWIDRALVAALVRALFADLGDADTSEWVERIAPPGMKRRISAARQSDVLRRPARKPRLVQPAVTAVVLDRLGADLRTSGHAEGDIQASERTAVLNEAVEILYREIQSKVAMLSAVGLVEFLIENDEAIISLARAREEDVSNRVACFGAEVDVEELIKESNRLTESALASRFLVEYVAAKPPNGATQIDLFEFDELLATACELISRATISDAVKYQFSDVAVSILPSGRLGISRGDRYSTATNEVASLEAEARVAMATEPPLQDSASHGEIDPATIAAVDAAALAEFGFTLHDLAAAVAELIEMNDESGRDTGRYAEADVSSRLCTNLGWTSTKVERLIDQFTLEPRDDFLSLGADAYPWKYNRSHSYLRRPLVRTNREGERSNALEWGTRRIWTAGLYWTELIYAARLKAKSKEMRSLLGSIRQADNIAFEETSRSHLESAGFPITRRGADKFSGKRMISELGDLGDIDALGLDPSRKILVLVEAKDFELARTPVELSSEVDALLIGPKSAAAKIGRRRDWILSNLGLVLREFELPLESGWSVHPVIVTSRKLVGPRVVDSDVRAISIDALGEWARSVQARVGAPRGAPRGRQ